MRFFKRRLVAGVALLSTALVGGSLSLGTQGALAAGVDGGPAVIVNPQNNQPIAVGGSQKVWTFDLPASPTDRCAGDSASGGYFVYTYITPSSNNPADLTFNPDSGPDQPAGSFAYPLFDTGGQAFVSRTTAPQTGQVDKFPATQFNFNRFSLTGGGGKLALPAGLYNLGVACWAGNATPPAQDRFWNVQLNFSANPGDPNGEAWWAAAAATTIATTLTSGAQTGQHIMLPVGGGGVTDKATLSGTNVEIASGTVTYTVFSDAECTTNFASGGTKTVTNGSVPPSDPVVFTAPGTYYWQASYSGDAPNGGSTSVCTDETVTVPPSADLGITKDDGRTIVNPGETVSYTIVVSNAGPSAATLASVTDDVPDALENVSWTCTPSGAGAACSTGAGTGDVTGLTVDLAAGTSATLTVTGTVAASASGTISNTASVASTNPGDPNTANNSATDTDNVQPPITVDAVNDSYFGQQGKALTAPAPGVLGNDTVAPPGSPALQASLVTGPSNGSVALQPNGSFVYTPNGGFFGLDSFLYQACSSTVCDTARASIQVAKAKTPTTLVARPNYVEVRAGYGPEPVVLSTGTFSATLKTASGAAIRGKTITFYNGGKSLCSAATDSAGVARCTAPLKQLVLQTLALGYQARFAGDADFAASSDHAPIVQVKNVAILGN